jgi:dephospho-CoA kinase
MRKLKVIGLTGGIGSGKSTVAAMFQELGVPVYFSDDEAKKLMVGSEALRAGIIDRFGEQAYTEKGLNTGYLAHVVFNDPESLEDLNQLVHPEVERHFMEWLSHQNSAYVIQENPLLFEKKKEGQYDAVIVVAAPTELRIDRVMKRDGVSKAEVETRLANQMDQAYKVERATYVIENDRDLKRCRDSVISIHQELLSEIP